jgi:DNA-binding PadR family transcriptional regulator
MNSHHHDLESCGRVAHDHLNAFGKHGFKPPFGMAGHPHGFGSPGGQRARRGDVRAAVLRLLSEKPMHGYQIIQELSQRSAGAWSPSAGSVYPTLQLLADEGLISAEESGGKKVFSLTEAGAATVAETADQPAPWEEAAQSDSAGSGYREAVGRLMQAAFQIGRSGSTTQVAAAVDVLSDARKKLYAILAED